MSHITCNCSRLSANIQACELKSTSLLAKCSNALAASVKGRECTAPLAFHSFRELNLTHTRQLAKIGQFRFDRRLLIIRGIPPNITFRDIFVGTVEPTVLRNSCLEASTL